MSGDVIIFDAENCSSFIVWTLMLEELYYFADLDILHKEAEQLGMMICVKTDFRTPQGLFSSIIYHCILR